MYNFVKATSWCSLIFSLVYLCSEWGYCKSCYKRWIVHKCRPKSNQTQSNLGWANTKTNIHHAHSDHFLEVTRAGTSSYPALLFLWIRYLYINFINSFLQVVYNIWWPVPRYRVNNCLCLFSHFHLPPPWSSSTFSAFLALKVSTGMLSCQVQVWLYFSHHRSLLTSTKCFGSTVTLLLSNSGCCCLLST
jgi:hypothetical protein